MNIHDALSCLGVKPSATIEEIKKEYRILAKKYHPDVSKNDPAVFVKLTAAYEYLIKYHKPSPASTSEKFVDTSKMERFYRGIVPVVELWEDEIMVDALIIMSDDHNMFKFVVPKGTKLPVKTKITYDHTSVFAGRIVRQKRTLEITVKGPSYGK